MLNKINSFKLSALGFLLMAPWLGESAMANPINLVSNGDFQSGNTGFTSGYTLYPGTGNLDEAHYAITDSPNTVHQLFANYYDHTLGTSAGRMMVVNGAGVTGVTIWGETVAVTPNMDYDFAAYLSSAYPVSPASLQFSINDISIGDLTGSTTTGQWDLFYATWNSGSATSANIRIINNNTALVGNDFALDDIYFGYPVYSVPEPGTFWLLSLAPWLLLKSRRSPDKARRV